MALFGRKKKAASSDPRVYAFVGLGMMARFMGGGQLDEFTAALPALIARECGASPENVAVVMGGEWLSKDNEFANSVNFDGTPAFPDAAQALCDAYLKRKGLTDHVVGDLELLGVLGKDGSLSMGTMGDLKQMGAEVTGASILVTAWLAFPRSALHR